jgi:hypothetical protein
MTQKKKIVFSLRRSLFLLFSFLIYSAYSRVNPPKHRKIKFSKLIFSAFKFRYFRDCYWIWNGWNGKNIALSIVRSQKSVGNDISRPMYGAQSYTGIYLSPYFIFGTEKS